MKKNILVALVSLIALTGCQSSKTFTPYLSYENNLPVIHRDGSEHTTYLMLSPFGSIVDYEGISTKGEVSDKYYENTVVLKAEAGTALPTAEQVQTTVEGASFRGWAYYDESNDNVWPDYYKTVPTENFVALKAIFDGTITSSGGGGGGSPSQSSKYGIIFGDGTTSFGSPMEKTDEQGRSQYLIKGQSFKKNDVFSLYDASTKGTWVINLDGYSLGGTAENQEAWKSYLSVDFDKQIYKVLQDFKGDLYIKLAPEPLGDQLYIGFAS